MTDIQYQKLFIEIPNVNNTRIRGILKPTKYPDFERVYDMIFVFEYKNVCKLKIA